MTKPRFHPPSIRVWKVSSKCVDDQFLLVPTEEVRTLVMLFLAKMQELYDVEIYACVFMGNHFHLLLGLREDRLPEIMRDFKSGLARALNRLYGRRGVLWMERYDDEAVLNDEAVETAIHYFHANPVRAHIVERADDYLGVSSWRAYADDVDVIRHTYFDETQWRGAGADESRRALFVRSIEVKIGRPPHWEGLSPSERRAKVAAMRANMREEERLAAADRAQSGRGVPTAEELVAIEPRSRPKRPKEKQPKRKMASGTDEQVREFHAAYRQMIPVYRIASLRYRETGILQPFPAGTYPPRIMYAFVES